MLRIFLFFLLILVLPGCIASENQLFNDGLDLGDEFGFFTLNSDDPGEGFLLIKNDGDNSYEMFGADDTFTSVFVNQLNSRHMILSAYSAENEDFYHMILHQRGEQFFILSEDVDQLDEGLEDQRNSVKQKFGYSDYAYRVRDRAHLEELVSVFENGVKAGFFGESEVELVRGDSDGAAKKLEPLRKRIEDMQTN